jgi:large subunit ribosomal protein L18
MKIIGKRRRIEARTNYSKRKKLLESRKPRIVIRKSNKYILIQFVESKFAQDSIALVVNSKELLDYSWPKEKEGSLKSLGAAYLAGLLFASKAKAKKLGNAILDTGLIQSTKGSRVYAALNGIIDGGFELPHNKEVFPAKERIENEENKSFFNKVKEAITKGAKK